MYGWMWRNTPGPVTVRVLLAMLALAAVTVVCFGWVFPAVSGAAAAGRRDRRCVMTTPTDREPLAELRVVTMAAWLARDLATGTDMPVAHDLGLDVPADTTRTAWWAPHQHIARLAVTPGATLPLLSFSRSGMAAHSRPCVASSSGRGAPSGVSGGVDAVGPTGCGVRQAG